MVVGAADWIEAGLGVRPSVSEAEIRDYEGMRAKYSNTCGSDKKPVPEIENAKDGHLGALFLAIFLLSVALFLLFWPFF